MLADCCESLLGGLWIDQGLHACDEFLAAVYFSEEPKVKKLWLSKVRIISQCCLIFGRENLLVTYRLMRAILPVPSVRTFKSLSGLRINLA